MGGGNVTVVGKTGVAYALRGISTTLEVLLTVQTHSNEEILHRPPLNLALVLDRSGSMSGNDKINFAKTAIKEVIDSLSEKDVLHLIAYDSEVDVIIENAVIGSSREAFKAKVESINTQGMTNLHGGLMRANEIIKNHDLAGYTKRIFLFSDGLANVGVTEHGEVNKSVLEVYNAGVRVDSFGIGKDFESKMMQNIAECGGGQFFYVESGDAIPKLVGKALQGLMRVIGINALLKVRGMNGAVVKKLYGYDDLINGCKLGDLRDSNQRQVLCQIEVSPSDSQESDCPILSYALSYSPLPSVDTTQMENVEISGVVSIKFTHDEELVKTQEKDKAVVLRLAIQKSADNDEEVQKLMMLKNLKEAISLQEKTQSLLSEVESLDPQLISLLLRMATLGLENLKKKGISEESEKVLSHGHYMKRRDSLDYFAHYS